jgi:hypothetical protein
MKTAPVPAALLVPADMAVVRRGPAPAGAIAPNFPVLSASVAIGRDVRGFCAAAAKMLAGRLVTQLLISAVAAATFVFGPGMPRE